MTPSTLKTRITPMVIVLFIIGFLLCLQTYKDWAKPHCTSTKIYWINNHTYEKVYELADKIEQCIIENKKPTIYLTGHGGGINVAVLFFDLIRTKGLSKDFSIIASGQISSSANIIFLSSNNRYSLPGTQFYWHEATSAANEPEATVLLNFANTQTGDIFERILGTETAKQWKDCLSGTTLPIAMTAEQAKEISLITHIIPYK